MHKATIKKAKKLGIKLEEKNGGIIASWKGYTTKSVKTAQEAVKKMAKIQSGMKDAEDKADREFPSLAALQKAKVIYKERGDINNCGDWLALLLADEFLLTEETDEGDKTTFDADGFLVCLEANKVPIRDGKKLLPFAGMRSRGWKGRFRMCGRQKLEVVVAEKGSVKIGRTIHKVPRPALAILRQKHPQV